MSARLDEHEDLLDSAERQRSQVVAGCVKPRGLRQEWGPIAGPHNFLTFVPYHWRVHMSGQHGSRISPLARIV
jgi:hypothetical protein